MQFASPSGRLALARGQLWGRARSSMGGGVLWSALIVFLLTYAIASSTATAGWVSGVEVLPLVALGGALLMAALAVLPIPWPAALGAGLIVGLIVALVAAGPMLHATHPLDPALVGAGGFSLRIVSIWWGRLTDGEAANDPSFYLFLICWLMWVTGAWLSWCVLRWRKPMLGLIPGAAAFATNLLNIPTNQNGYTLSILVLTLALLLWTNYTGSIASANRAHVKLTGDARWDFWESGLVAMAALIVLGVMLPPLSTVDRTVDVESNLFSNWAQLQQRLTTNPGVVGTGPGGSGTTGFSPDVPLGGPLTRTTDPVFTYTKDTKVGDYASTMYFRGVDVTATVGGEWRYSAAPGLRRSIGKNQTATYAENYAPSSDRQRGHRFLSRPALPGRPPHSGDPGCVADSPDRQPVFSRSAFVRLAADRYRELCRDCRVLERDRCAAEGGGIQLSGLGPAVFDAAGDRLPQPGRHESNPRPGAADRDRRGCDQSV
jgi:hypothetical protein